MRKDIPIINHPGAALIVPFISKNEVVMLRQFRPVINKHLYGLPAGTLEGGEAHISCARRELIEKTRYPAGRFIKSGYIYPVPGYSTKKRWTFYRECFYGEPFLGVLRGNTSQILLKQ